MNKRSNPLYRSGKKWSHISVDRQMVPNDRFLHVTQRVIKQKHTDEAGVEHETLRLSTPVQYVKGR